MSDEHGAGHVSAGGAADSAGVPWAGRTFHANPHAGDDGRPDPAVASVIERHAAFGSSARYVDALVGALRTARVLVPVMAYLGESAHAEAKGPGQVVLSVDKSADVGLVSVQLPDGRMALPVFTSVAALQRWHPQARPIPTPMRQAAVAAVSDGQDVMLCDPGSAHGVRLPRPAVWAVAQDQPWKPFLLNDLLVRQVEQAITAVHPVVTCAAVAGDDVEVVLRVGLPPGLGQAELQRTQQQLYDALAGCDAATTAIDSIRIALHAVSV